MKNTKFIPGASKAEEKVKRQTQKKKKTRIFSLRQVSKRGIKRISSEQKKKTGK
jgi:hypothetical protein